jgi:TP901 family phage tail tape measure protein
MTVRTASLVMELLDRVTGPARSVSRSLRGLGNTIRDMPTSASFSTKLDAAIARNNAAIDRSRLAVVEATATAWAFSAALSAPIRAAGNFETALENIGQKAGLPVERLGALGERIQSIARATNTSASDIAAAVDGLVGRGMDVDAALAVADPIARAAVAYGASTEDLAATAMTAVDNMKIPADQILSVFDALAQAGKDGAFELKDMATYLPSLGAQYAAMGQQGVGALSDLGAAAQVLRKDTGDASTAATRLQNVLQKTYSPATIKKFADKGVDLMAEMEKAAQRGLTPLEAIASITKDTLGGDMSKIGFLFEDAEAQAGIRSLILHQQEFQRIRAEALKAQNVVMKDYERRVRTAQGAQRRWSASVESLNVALGNTLLPLLNDLLDRVVPIIYRIQDLATKFPEATRAIAAAAGSLIAFRASMAALKLIGLTGKGGVLSLMQGAMGLIGESAGRAAGAVEASVARQNRALNRLKLGALTAGAMAAIALAKVPSYPDKLREFQAQNREAMEGAFRQTPLIGDLMRGYERIFEQVHGRQAPTVDAERRIAELNKAIATLETTGASSVDMDALLAKQSELTTRLADMQAALDASPNPFGFDPEIQKVAQELRDTEDAIRTAGETTAKLQAALKAVGMTDASPVIDQSSLDRALTTARQLLAAVKEAGTIRAGDAGGGTGIDGRRAKGGPMSPGRTYLVGEKGPEFVTPTRSGHVHPNGAGGGGGPMTVNLSPSFVINGVNDPAAILAYVERGLTDTFRRSMRGTFADYQGD